MIDTLSKNSAHFVLSVSKITKVLSLTRKQLTCYHYFQVINAPTVLSGYVCARSPYSFTVPIEGQVSLAYQD